jgi:hypothetical protein
LTPANTVWNGREAFGCLIVDSVEHLDAVVRSMADEGHSACLTAGSGREMPGIPPSNFWASDPNGINQVGCVYTAQGFEFDYVRVIFGRDLRWDPDSQDWIADRSESFDSIVKLSGDRFTELVKRTYRLLPTPGMQGCYVYFGDQTTRAHVQHLVAAI